MPKYRTQSRRYLRQNPKGSQNFTGLQDWGFGVRANPRVDNASRGHDGDFTNFEHPYTTTQAADERWMRRIGDDYSIPAVVGKAIFSAKAALLPRSRRSWNTVQPRRSNITTGPQPLQKQRLPQALRAPTVSHVTNNRIMPKRIRTGYSTYSSPAPGRKGGRIGVKAMTKAEHRTLALMKRQISRDIKNVDTAIPSTSLDNLGAFWQVAPNVAQGDSSEQERLGNYIDLKSFSFNLQVAAGSAGAACQFVRLMVIKDKQANGKEGGVDWGVDEILQGPVVGPPAFPGSVNATDRFRNLNETGRFQVLYDRRVMLNEDTASGKRCAIMKKNLSFKQPIRIQYEKKTTTGAVGTIKDNNVWLMMLSDDTVNLPTVIGGLRTKYYD